MQQLINLKSLVKNLPSVGGVYNRRLEQVGINTIEDLLYYFPFRYEDLSNRKTIPEVKTGDKVTIQAQIWQITKIRTKLGKTLIKAVINDGNNSLDVIWFNQVYLLTVLKPHQLINFSGKIGLFNNKPTLTNPTYEIIKGPIATPIHTDRLVPVYSESAGISSKWFRSKIHLLLEDLKTLGVEEYLPKELMESEGLVQLDQALAEIHFPKSFDGFLEAKKRLAFEELLLLHLKNHKIATSQNQGTTQPLNTFQKSLEKLKNKLPFKLTISQNKAIAEILGDLEKNKPMNRMLQGEVGSGKTIVSAFALKTCIDNGFQAALMAPTEILARQHFATLRKVLPENKIILHTGSSKTFDQEFQIIVGTHALINKSVTFTKLGLVVVDEQQRFGVVQRSILKNYHPAPHFLTMTATPIPRTLALTIYGHLDISVLEELPHGRKTIKTYLVPRIKRDDAYEFIRKEVRKGGQTYIICPLIEESESLLTVKSAKTEFEHLSKVVFADLKLGLLHGKMSSREKTSVIEEFREGKIDILVSTPVVEVGIDVPNANITLIEASERFGLASLHQLRGRVGRGERQSYCLLFSENQSTHVTERLKLMEKFDNGLKLAEMDLERRGPGDIYGILQHGQLDLKLANTSDLELIVKSKTWAEKLGKTQLPSQIEEKIAKQLSTETQILSD